MDDIQNSIPGALETMEPSNPPALSAGAGTGTGTATSSNNNSPNTTTNTANSASAAAAPPSTTKRYRATPAKTFACRGYGECRMVFSRSEHLARHVRKHTGERPFACHCGKQFSRLDNLRQHAQTVHADKQDQNERMMRELTTLHTTISQGAKRDARKKAVQASAPQGPVGIVPGVSQNSPMHPSIHPHASPHPSLLPTPMHPMGGTAPAHLATYAAPPGHVFPGHMHAQSMSALPFDAPQHQATPRYGRGRPGTSAGYEGSGFDAHTYDPRRGGWPGTGPGGAGNQPQGGGNGGFDHPGHHHAHTPPHPAPHSGHSGHPHHSQAPPSQQQQPQHPSQPGFREPPTAHTHPPPQEGFRDGGGGTAGGGMGAMGLGLMSGMTHPHPPPPQHTEIGMGTPQSMPSSIHPPPTSGASKAQGNQNTAQGRVVSDQQRSVRQESGFGNNSSNQRAQGTPTQQQLQQLQQHRQQMEQQHRQQQQQQQPQTGFGSPMAHHPMHHTESSSGIRGGLGQQRAAAQGASEAGFGTHPHHSRQPTQFSGTGAQMAGITMHQQQQVSDSDSPRQRQPSSQHTNNTTTTNTNTNNTSSNMDMDTEMDTEMGIVTSYQQQQQPDLRRQQNIGSGLVYPDGSFLEERGRGDGLGSKSSVGARRVAEEGGESGYPPSTATTALGASPSPGGPGSVQSDDDDHNDANDEDNIDNKHSTHTTSKTPKSEPPPPRSGGGHSFLGGRSRNNDIDHDDSPRTAYSTSSRREKERGESSESFARSQWYRSGSAAYFTAPGPAQQYAAISPNASSSRDVYGFSSSGYPPQHPYDQRAIVGYDDAYGRRYPPSTAGGASESSSSSTHRAPSQTEQYQRYSRASATARSSTSSAPPSPASSLPSATDASPGAEPARSSTHERAHASPHDRHISHARPQSSRTGVRYEQQHVPPYDGSHRVFSHDAQERSRTRSKPRHASYDESRSKEYDSDSEGPNDGGWGRPVTAPAGRSWGTSGGGYGGYGSGGYPQFQYAPPPQYAYGAYDGWGYAQYPPQYPPPYPYPQHHHQQPYPYPYPYPPYGPAGPNRMDGYAASGMGRHGGGVYEREYTSESPFSFHPPGLERPLTGPGVSGESSSGAAAPGTASGRKRAAPDSEFDSYGRPTTSSGGIFAFGRPDTAASSSRPQSRRLTVMEICNDVVPPGSSAGGGGRFLPVSRPTTADSRVLPPPRSGISFAAAGVNPGPSPLRPNSSGGSPFAFAYPGDGSNERGGRGREGERDVTPPTRAREHSEEASTAAGADADRSDPASECDARSVSGTVKFLDGAATGAGQGDGGANDTATSTAIGTKSEPKSSSSGSISSATPTASPRVRDVSTTPQIASDTRSPSSRSVVSKSPASSTKSPAIHNTIDNSAKSTSQSSPKQSQLQSPQHSHASPLSVSQVAVDVNSNLRDGVRV